MRDSLRKCFGERDITPYHETSDLNWEEMKERAPSLTKGWFELAQLDGSLRIEFLRDYWINSLPYSPQVFAFIDRFFAQVEEIGIFEVKKTIYMTYSLKRGCFIGRPPLLDQQIETLKEQTAFPLPQDYLQFFRIHNGFSKAGDTGVLPSHTLIDEREKLCSWRDMLRCGEENIESWDLFPFYRSFSSDVYQCFYKNWYVDEYVGNVLCSLPEGTVSNFRNRDKGTEYLAFPSFLDWLVFYLEDVE